MHLIVATQKPDSSSFDQTVKSNLPGVLCFQMVNDVSSISVLGTGRATDLPPNPGRGIWKNSLDMVEVQTPFMTLGKAESLLSEFYSEEEQSPKAGGKEVVASAPAEVTLDKAARPKEKSDAE